MLYHGNAHTQRASTLNNAIKLFCVSDIKQTVSALQGQQQPWLAVGLWTQDQVLLQDVNQDAPNYVLECADVGQPRSIMAAEMEGSWLLFVGTSLGWVLCHPLTWQSGELIRLWLVSNPALCRNLQMQGSCVAFIVAPEMLAAVSCLWAPRWFGCCACP